MTAHALRLIVLFLVVLVLTGCQQVDFVEPSRARPPAEPAHDAITIRLRSDPFAGSSPFTPLESPRPGRPLTRLVFAGATTLGPDLLPRPELAERWTVTPNGLVWLIHLRPGLRWHDGEPVTAEDFAFTYRLLQAGRSESPAAITFQQVVEDVTVIDERTVRLALRRPFAPLAAELATPILPKHILREHPSPAEADVRVGAGPFRLLEYHPGHELVLEAFSPIGPRRLGLVTFEFASDEQTVLEGLQDGRYNVAEIAADTPADRIPSNYREAIYPEIGFDYVAFNLRPGRLFADPALRAAFDLAIDRTALANVVGGVTPIWSHIPLSSWAFDETLPQPSPDLAKAGQLLDQAGWVLPDPAPVDRDSEARSGLRSKDGVPLEFDLLVRQDAPERVAAAHLIADRLALIGMRARVRPVDFASTLTEIRRPPFAFDAAIMGWDLGADPDDYLLFASGQIPTDSRPNLLNYVGFRNDEFDRLSFEARTTTAQDRRQELYRQTQRLIARERPYLPLWSRTTRLVAAATVRGALSLDSPYYLWNLAFW